MLPPPPSSLLSYILCLIILPNSSHFSNRPGRGEQSPAWSPTNTWRPGSQLLLVERLRNAGWDLPQCPVSGNCANMPSSGLFLQQKSIFTSSVSLLSASRHLGWNLFFLKTREIAKVGQVDLWSTDNEAFIKWATEVDGLPCYFDLLLSLSPFSLAVCWLLSSVGKKFMSSHCVVILFVDSWTLMTSM